MAAPGKNSCSKQTSQMIYKNKSLEVRVNSLIDVRGFDIIDAPSLPRDPRFTILLKTELFSSKDEIDAAFTDVETYLVVRFLYTPIEKVFAIFRLIDKEKDGLLLGEILLHFTMVIYNLPTCPDQDLPLAVYLFIEDKLNIQSTVKFCKKVREDDRTMDVGVIFDNIMMKYDVLIMGKSLKDTDVRFENNKSMVWVDYGLLDLMVGSLNYSNSFLESMRK